MCMCVYVYVCMQHKCTWKCLNWCDKYSTMSTLYEHEWIKIEYLQVNTYKYTLMLRFLTADHAKSALKVVWFTNTFFILLYTYLFFGN